MLSIATQSITMHHMKQLISRDTDNHSTANREDNIVS